MQDNFIAYLKHLEFQNLEWIWLLLILPAMVAFYIFKYKKRTNTISYSNTSVLSSLQKSNKQKIIHVPFVLRCMAIILLIVALARPQSSLSWQNITTEGIDVILSMDVSLSMLAQDLKPNRIQAAKDVAIDFISERPNDRIGLVVFSGEGFTQCPLTTDHAVVKNLLSDIKTGMLADGTAIGMGLATAVNRIKDSEAKSKVIILLTDGVNNAGNVAPETAAEIAKAFGVRVYTIGAGSKGMAYSPVGMYPNGQYAFDYVPVSIDEPLMRKIAETTGGKYFRATSTKGLRQVYKEIDKLEKTKIEVTEYRKKSEEYLPFLLLSLLFLIIEFMLKHIYLRSITD